MKTKTKERLGRVWRAFLKDHIAQIYIAGVIGQIVTSQYSWAHFIAEETMWGAWMAFVIREGRDLIRFEASLKLAMGQKKISDFWYKEAKRLEKELQTVVGNPSEAYALGEQYRLACSRHEVESDRTLKMLLAVSGS